MTKIGSRAFNRKVKRSFVIGFCIYVADPKEYDTSGDSLGGVIGGAGGRRRSGQSLSEAKSLKRFG